MNGTTTTLVDTISHCALTAHTDYSDIQLEGDDANNVADHLETLLEHKLVIGEYEEDT